MRPGKRNWRFTKRAGPLLLSLGALAAIALGGFYLWTRWVVDLLGSLDPASPLAALGFLAGLTAFFSPCAFSLFPGYISYAMASAGAETEARLASSLRLGTICAAGAISFFLLIGIGLSALGGSLSPFLITAKPLFASALVLLGLLLLLDRPLNLPFLQRLVPTGSPGTLEHSPWKGIFLYGFGYGLASTGCTLPVYMSVVIFPLFSGQVWAGLVTFLSFAVAMGLLMLAVTVLVGFSRQALIHRIQASTGTIQRLSGLVLILVGLYGGYYYLIAGMA